MGRTYQNEGEILTYTNPSSSVAIAVDTVITLVGMIAVAIVAIAASAAGSVSVRGKHRLSILNTDVVKIGDPLWWDIANARLTRLAAAGCVFAGIAAEDKATGVYVIDILINERGNLPESVLCRLWEDVADNKTLDAEDVGKVMNVTVDAKTITLPAAAAGLEFVIRNGGADAAVLVTIDPNTTETLSGPDWTGGAGVTRLNTKATAKRGDFLQIRAVTGGWVAVSYRGIWAAGA